MAYGLKIFDQYGNVIVDSTKRLSRVLGMVDVTGGVDGSLTDTRFSTGQFWHVTIPRGVLSNFGCPYVAVSGNNLSWTFPSGSGVNCTIIYGVF